MKVVNPLVSLDASRLDTPVENIVPLNELSNPGILNPSYLAKIACETDGFETLCHALERTELDKVLGGDSMFTVFAPTNDAFNKLGIDLDDLDDETLSDILLFHVIAEKEIPRGDLKCRETVEMANGRESRTVCDSGERFQKGAGNPSYNKPRILFPDITACNGIIHVIDEVMLSRPSPSTTCDSEGFSHFPFQGLDNSQRLLLREGVISEIPPKLCPQDREMTNITKNVILVIGDGMVCVLI